MPSSEKISAESELKRWPPEAVMIGIVTPFDLTTLIGIARLEQGNARFHSTSFQASTFRWPRVGERVEVVTNKSGELLSVHGA
jgi:hypothetical protein